MNQNANSPPARRPALATAFDHLAASTATADITAEDDETAMFLKGLRASMPRYGDVEPPPPLDDVTIEPDVVAGVPVEWVYARNARTDRRIVYIHGGGWVGGHPAHYRFVSATLARLTAIPILMVDYRLAPEHPFPAGLDDCTAVFAWAEGHGPGSSETAAWLCLAGDSAGGNLATATSLRMAQQGGRMPDRLCLIAGTLDNHTLTDRIGVDDPICTQDAFRLCNAAYLRGPDTTALPLVSPMFADERLLARFPPTLLQASGLEALLSDSRRFADRLERAGVRVNLSIWPGLPHVWHLFHGLFPEAAAALEEIGTFLTPGMP